MAFHGPILEKEKNNDMQTARGEKERTLLDYWHTQYRIMDAPCMLTVLGVRHLHEIPYPGR
jgi:hypothetical protein